MPWQIWFLFILWAALSAASFVFFPSFGIRDFLPPDVVGILGVALALYTLGRVITLEGKLKEVLDRQKYS